jgi:CBS domain-containing protein
MSSQSSLAPVIDFLRRHAPFDQMAPAHLEFLAKRLKLAFYSRDEAVIGPDQGPADRFCIIKQGRVRGETSSAEATEEGAWELVTGECFPIGALLSRRPVRTVSRAAEDTFCFELDRRDFEQLMAKSAVFQDFCTRRIANLLDSALRGVQASSASRVSEDSLSTPLQALVRRAPVTCTPDNTIREALERMDRERVGSIVVVDKSHQPVGVFTLHDVLSRVTLPAIDMKLPISEVMTPRPVALQITAFAYEAARLMAQNGFSHICIVDENRLVGVLSERDLFSLQRVGLANLSRAINSAESIQALVGLEKDVHRLVEQMMAQGASIEQLMQIITTLNDHMTRRVIVICESEMGKPPFAYTWLAFGSEGRLEQTLKTDQDNGILFQVPPGATPEQVRAKLLPLAKRINEALAEVGFPLCRGNVMGSNPECCLSMDEWKRRFMQWIEEGSAQHLMFASIFFDFRTIYGDAAIGEQLREFVTRAARDNRGFLKRMAVNALNNRPPLGLVRDFVVRTDGDHPNTLDLKINGITPFVDAARIFALTAGLSSTSTITRLREAGEQWEMDHAVIEGWVQGFVFLQLLRFRQHSAQKASGQPLTNRVEPDALNDLDRRILKEAFRQARKLQSRLETFFQF